LDWEEKGVRRAKHKSIHRARASRFTGLALAALCTTPALAQEKVDSVFSVQAQADKAAAGSQQRIDQLQDQTQDMLAKYRQALVDAESIKKYNEQIGAQVKAQAERIGEMRKQLASIESTQRDVLPLMAKMVTTLEQFVKLDVPFLPEERARRVDTLKGLLSAADVPNSEKYRRILEAYQIEMEYGRTLDSYEGKLGEGDAAKNVTFVRLGRIALMYQTPDGKESGYWDVAKKSWTVDNDYARDIRHALAIAKKQGAPDLLRVPVPAPTAKETKS
jgi:hypothetical protein